MQPSLRSMICRVGTIVVATIFLGATPSAAQRGGYRGGGYPGGGFGYAGGQFGVPRTGSGFYIGGGFSSNNLYSSGLYGGGLYGSSSYGRSPYGPYLGGFNVPYGVGRTSLAYPSYALGSDYGYSSSITSGAYPYVNNYPYLNNYSALQNAPYFNMNRSAYSLGNPYQNSFASPYSAPSAVVVNPQPVYRYVPSNRSIQPSYPQPNYLPENAPQAGTSQAGSGSGSSSNRIQPSTSYAGGDLRTGMVLPDGAVVVSVGPLRPVQNPAAAGGAGLNTAPQPNLPQTNEPRRR